MISSSEMLAYTGPAPVDYPVGEHPDAARVLEIGPGAGSGTLALLDALPHASVVCLEPDDAARNALLWRLREHPERDRVTILPMTVEAAAPVGEFDLVVARHVVCQLEVPGRPAFWSAVRDRMTLGGVALVDSHLGRTATGPRARARSARARNGSTTVERWFTLAEHDGRLRVTNEYLFVDDHGRVLHADVQSHEVDVVDDDAARAQITASGLSVEDRGDGWLRLTRA